ncbi:MAG: hypothetical protein ACTSWC_10645 [Promethearchaeota archaeon]
MVNSGLLLFIILGYFLLMWGDIIEEAKITYQKLQTLLHRLEYLENQAEVNSDQLLEENLIPIFQELTSFLNSDELDLGLSILKSGTSILSLKIEAIKHYILLLSQNELITQFIENCQDDKLLCSLINQSWQTPFCLTSISSSFLFQSYKNLVAKKHTRNLNSEKKAQELTFSSEKTEKLIHTSSEEFHIELLNFYNTIIPLLPCQLSKLLQPFSKPSEYFQYFSYILHLTQEGLIQYDPSKKEFFLTEKEM